MLSLIQKMISRFNQEKLPEQYYDMDLTTPQVKSIGMPKVEGLDLSVMDASKVKTMKTGGSVEIEKSKDYIKDLL
jgi:hypothetical protein